MLALVSDVFAGAPSALVAITLGSAAVGLVTWVALVRRVERRFTKRPLPPVSFARKLFTFVVAVAAAAVAVVGVLLLAALAGQRAVAPDEKDGTRLAEVQCLETAPGKLRLYYVGLDREGQRGPTRIFDLTGARCAITGEVQHLRPVFSSLGPAYARVVRVSGKPATDGDVADTAKQTVVELGPASDDARGWLAARGSHGPLRIMTDTIDGNTVVTAPDPHARLTLVWKTSGFSLGK